MHVIWWLVGYSLLVLLISMGGGHLPFLFRVTHGRLQLYLSISAGVMLGASFFHVMPEAWNQLKHSEVAFGLWLSLGVVGLFCIERFIAPHSHEVNPHAPAEHDHAELGAGHHHDHAHDHAHVSAAGEHRSAAPSVAGWMAVVGLTIHTFMNGVGLAGQVVDQFGNVIFPGLTIFLAIFLHKPADALAISTVLTRKGTERFKIVLVQLGFAAMVPLGAAVFYFSRGAIDDALKSELTGAALAFSAGTFLFIALSDLLPEVQFHRHDRLLLFLALVVAVAGMGGIAMLEDHDHGHNDHGAQEKDHGHNHGHGHKH